MNASVKSISTTTTTTRDRGDRYGPIEWAQQENHEVPFPDRLSVPFRLAVCAISLVRRGSDGWVSVRRGRRRRNVINYSAIARRAAKLEHGTHARPIYSSAQAGAAGGRLIRSNSTATDWTA